MSRLYKSIIIPAVLFAVFSSISRPCAAAGTETLTVAGAASLTYALRDIAEGFERSTGVKVVVSYGSTGILAGQIRSGAPFDIFLAADTSTVDGLRDDGLLVRDSVAIYATGVIVLVSRSDPDKAVKGLKDLLRPDIRWIAIANPEHAPYGRAGKEALVSAGIWDALKEKVVYGENIRQTMQFVQTGDADAGIVALSVAEAPGVSVAPIDAGLYKPLEQAAGILMTSKHLNAAREFLRFLTGDEGARIFRKYGFGGPVGKK